MKKILSILLVLCMLFSCIMLASCEDKDDDEEQKTPAQEVAAAVKKNEKLEDAEYTLNMTMSMEIPGYGTYTIPVTVDMLVENAGAENERAYAEVEMDMGLMGSMSMKMYTADGWAYYDMEDYQYKMKLEDLTDDEDYSKIAGSVVKEIPESVFGETQFTANEDGTKSITLNLTQEQCEQVFGDLLENMSEMAYAEEGASMSISNVVVKITLDKGYVSNYDVAFDMGVTMEGETITANCEASVEYKNLGKDVTITPMEGYESYEEMTLE